MSKKEDIEKAKENIHIKLYGKCSCGAYLMPRKNKITKQIFLVCSKCDNTFDYKIKN